MQTDDILITEQGHLGIFTLNRPNALHALTPAMILAIQNQLNVWKIEPNIHAIIIQATPSAAFCAGGDVRWLYDNGKNDFTQVRDFFWHEYRLNHFIHNLGKPWIALMDGITMGGGVGISLHGSHPVASEKFTFAMPETGIGFFPDIGASHLLSKCPDSIGIYLGLTGNRITAQEALSNKLIKYFIHSEKFPAIVQRLHEEDLSKDAFAKVDACLESYALSLINQSEISGLDPAISQCFSKNSVEEIIEALKETASGWANKQLSILHQKSPVSLKVTFQQLQKAKNLSLADCLKMDFFMVNHFMDHHDFYEGVRALLVHKDKQPVWEPASLHMVTQEMVDGYFEPICQELDLLSV